MVYFLYARPDFEKMLVYLHRWWFTEAETIIRVI